MLRVVLAVFCLATALGSAVASPSRLIILRHGEKADEWRLCGVGQQRADALAADFLGRGAKRSLFRDGEEPAAFFGITLHTLELASPAASTWQKPVILFSVVPKTGGKDLAQTKELNRRTQQAVQELMTNPAYDGKTVVLVWEHRHIANAKLEAGSRGEQVTLRQLLKLDGLKDVPGTWPSENFNYFWIVDFAPGSATPTGFTMQRQDFASPYDKLPANDWGVRDSLKPASGCETKSRK